MDIEIEQKDNKKEFSENKIGFSDSKVIEEMNKQELKKYQPRKGDRIMDKLSNSLNNRKYI